MNIDIIFAKLALAKGLLSREQHHKASLLQQQSPQRRFSEICLEQGWLDAATQQSLLKQAQKILRQELKYQQQNPRQAPFPSSSSAHKSPVELSQQELLDKVARMQHSDTVRISPSQDPIEQISPEVLAKLKSLQDVSTVRIEPEEAENEEDEANIPPEIREKLKSMQDLDTMRIDPSSGSLDEEAKSILSPEVIEQLEGMQLEEITDQPLTPLEEEMLPKPENDEPESEEPDFDSSVINKIASEFDTNLRIHPYDKSEDSSSLAAVNPPTKEQQFLPEHLENSSKQFGCYSLLGVLAEGGMGVVYKARHEESQQIVALKIMRELDIEDSQQLHRFEREIESTRKLNHPNIIKILDAGKIEETAYLTMEYVEGTGLLEHCQQNKLGPLAVARLMEKICRAVDYAHKNHIIHRDLKPENILVDNKGEPHIMDFGLAIDLSLHGKLTQSGIAVGTPYYMAPEQALANRKKIGPATDVYALGVILYELLSGKVPFDAESLEDLYNKIVYSDPPSLKQSNPNISHSLEIITFKAIAKEPKNRYLSAKLLASDLKKFSSGKPIQAKADSKLTRTVRNFLRRKVLIVIAILLVCYIGVLVWLVKSDSGLTPEQLNKQFISQILKEMKQLEKNNEYRKLKKQAIHAIKVHHENSAIVPAYRYLGKSFFQENNYNKALENYIHLYCKTNDKSEEKRALEGMQQCCQKLARAQEAQKITEYLKENY